ncbi:MAG: peptidoglycan D,D-transpeptidase FtsI family protein [Solirubrobacterales bacterium]
MRRIDQRAGLLFALFLLVFAIALARSVWLQGVRGGELAAEAHSQQVADVVVPGKRGAILDRNGSELAVSEDAATIIATPYQVKDPAATAAKLAQILEMPEKELLEPLSDRESGFAYLARKVSLPATEEIRKLKIEGLAILPDSRRIYPEGKLASQLIGSVGLENQGLTGLEASREELLHGSDGERSVTRDALGDEISRDTLAAATTGEDLQLTIDSALQAHTEDVIAGIGETYTPKGATAIVMDPDSSEVLALANWPPADPVDIGSATQRQILNRATGLTYEPGSTFKAFTVAGALEDDFVTPETTFTLGPTLQVADRTIEESHAGSGGTLSVADILAQSSNVGAVTIGLELGAERFDGWVRKFGFGDPTGVAIPGEERGIVLDVDDYSGSTMGNLPLGQGLSVTPMQMIAAYAAIANGGILRSPRILASEGKPALGERVISEKTSAQVRAMLEGVLAEGGTASEVSVPGYELAGKTGTSEKAIRGGYSETDFIASFVGFAPADDPELLVAVVVDEPRGSYYGGDVAAPAFGEIARFALPYLEIAP